jgi:PAS domain S-box-containing protein
MNERALRNAREGNMESVHSIKDVDEQSFSDDEHDGSSRRLFEDLIASIADLKVHRSRIDVQGMYCAWGGESQKIFGYSGDEVIGKMYFHDMFVRDADYRRVWRVASERGVFSGEIVLKGKGGHQHRMWLTVVKRINRNRDTTGYIVTALDRDEKRKLEDQIEVQMTDFSHFKDFLAKPGLELLTLERQIDSVREELGKSKKYNHH